MRSTPLHRFYSLCGTLLQNVHEARYLGINLSDDLQWRNYIWGIADKSSSTLGLLKRNLSKCPQKLREQAYISLIRSRMEYCAAVGIHTWLRTSTSLKASNDELPDSLSRITVVSPVYPHTKGSELGPLKDRKRDIWLAMLFKIVKCNMPVQDDTIYKCTVCTMNEWKGNFYSTLKSRLVSNLIYRTVYTQSHIIIDQSTLLIISWFCQWSNSHVTWLNSCNTVDWLTLL